MTEKKTEKDSRIRKFIAQSRLRFNEGLAKTQQRLHYNGQLNDEETFETDVEIVSDISKDSPKVSRKYILIKPDKKKSLFYYWILDNKIVVFMLISILIITFLQILSNVFPLLNPFFEFFKAINIPLIASIIMYFILRPIVERLERFKVGRRLAIWISFLLVILIISFSVIAIIPSLQTEYSKLLNDWPLIWDELQVAIDRFYKESNNPVIQEQIDIWTERVVAWFSSSAKNIFDTTVQGLGSFFGFAVNFFITIVTAPVLTYYLLLDGKRLLPTVTNALPNKARPHVAFLLKQIHTKLSLYIVGQMTVAGLVGVIFFIGYSIIGLPYAGLLAILAAVLNVIPWIGSLISMAPAYLIAVTQGFWMVVLLTVVLLVEQVLENRIISPLILGNRLEVHPIIIMLIILAAGSIGGVGGVILAVPLYAVFKVVFDYLFNLFRQHSDFYYD